MAFLMRAPSVRTNTQRVQLTFSIHRLGSQVSWSKELYRLAFSCKNVVQANELEIPRSTFRMIRGFPFFCSADTELISSGLHEHHGH